MDDGAMYAFGSVRVFETASLPGESWREVAMSPFTPPFLRSSEPRIQGLEPGTPDGFRRNQHALSTELMSDEMVGPFRGSNPGRKRGVKLLLFNVFFFWFFFFFLKGRRPASTAELIGP